MKSFRRFRSIRRSATRVTATPRSTARPVAAGSRIASTSTSVRKRSRTAPASATGRGDLINGVKGTGNLVTVAEQMTRFMFVGYAATKETNVVMSAVIGLLAGLPKEFLKSLTFDNGKEFAAFKQLVQALGIEVYFAKPYHSWERGTNENRNGIVRKVLPKGRAFDHILEAEMKRIDYMLNDRPLKCLNWRTPREAFTALLNRYLGIAA